ncbi:MAG: AI-2E family transporter [Acidimicrobiia bacterium]
MRVPEGGSSLNRWGRASWHVVGIMIVVFAAAWVLWRLRLVVLPLFIALLAAVALSPIRRWLMRVGIGRSLASAMTVALFIGAIVGFGFLVVPALTGEFQQLDDEVRRAADRLEAWVDEQRPFGLDGNDVQRVRAEIEGTEVDAIGTGAVLRGIRAVGSLAAALLFAIVATFFFVRDGRTMCDWLVGVLPSHRRDDGQAALDAVHDALAGYIRGALVLGLVEGVVVTITLALVGSDLAFVVGLLTVISAFVPFVGAIAAGAIAIAVALVTAGTAPALIVAAVVLLVQQLDNDLLAPVIYGRFLKIHPLAVLASLAVGIETAGLLGAFAAVPIAASIVAVTGVLVRRRRFDALTG